MLNERSNPPVRGAGGFAVSGGRAGSKVGAPHCPQNASSRLSSFPHLGHLITVLLLLLRLLNCYALVGRDPRGISPAKMLLHCCDLL